MSADRAATPLFAASVLAAAAIALSVIGAAPFQAQERGVEGAKKAAGDAGGAAKPAAKPKGRDLDELRRSRAVTDVDRAIRRGLEFLVEAQKRAGDGSFGGENRNATTGLAVLAFLACGHLPDETREGQAAQKGLAFVLADPRLLPDGDGYLGATDGSRMYGHGIAVVMLAELVGMGASPADEARMRAALKRGVEVILRAQAVPKEPREAGGWRYEPTADDSDLSVSVWQIVALRAARNAGLEVPSAAIDRARAFVVGCRDREQGAFAYRRGRDPNVSMAAAGLLALQATGVYEGKEVSASAEWLEQSTPAWRRGAWEDAWFYYSAYYYAQALYQLGGRYEELARSQIKDLLLPRQLADGSWDEPPRSGEERKAGPIYRTAMAVLALAVDYRLLPIYQR
jgi:hypothetical protein